MQTKYARFIHILIMISIILGISSLFNIHYWNGCQNNQYSGSHEYMESSWIYRKGDTVLEPEITVPAFRQMEKGETYSVSTALTYDGSIDRSPTCFYFVDHMFSRVLLDGEVIFSYMPEDIHKPDLSKSPGNVYAAVGLPNDCIGKTLTIEFIPALDVNIEYQLPNPSFGDYSTQLADTFWEDLPHNIIAVLALCLGLFSLLYASLSMSGSNYREGIFIGIFALLFGLYNFTESDFDFYMISNPYFTYVLDYTTFTLIPVFFMAFLREHMGPRQKKISLGIILAAGFLFTAEIIMHLTGIMDMRESLTVIHIVNFSATIFHLILLIFTPKSRWKKQLILQMLPMLFGAVIDFMVYYAHWDLGSSDSTFSSVGVILFLIVEILYLWRYSKEIYDESTQSRIYLQMACIDSLTAIGNRRALEMEKNALADGRKKFESLTVVSADINNLKITNDTMGHASGDFLIRSAANVLSDFCAGRGQAFRIGGDEFLVFIYDTSPEELANRLNQLHRQVISINRNSRVSLHLALGVHDYTGNIESSIAEADRKMYQNKRELKTALAKQTE